MHNKEITNEDKQKKEIMWRKTKTVVYKKARTVKRPKANSKYKIIRKDTCVHVDQNIIPITMDAKNCPLSINDLSGIQKLIIISILVLGVEDKPKVSGNTITNYILKYYYQLQLNKINDPDNKNVENCRKKYKKPTNSIEKSKCHFAIINFVRDFLYLFRSSIDLY